MASDAESDGFGAFDFGEFTADDFEEIDRDVATKLVEPSFTTLFGLAGGHTANSGGLSSSSSSSVSSDEHNRGPERPHGQGREYASESFEFDASLDLNNLAEEDFLAIDDAINLLSNPPPTREEPMSLIPAPAILDAPRIDPPENDGPVAKPRWRYNGKKNGWKLWKDKSLLERYKPAGILSVTDLVSPTWCEVQIDYGLRQKRWKPVDKRPKTFKTESGKEITVEVKVAEQNDVRTKQGQAVHTVLEREVRPEEVKVDIATNEERWGLKLLNLIACFESLLAEGMTREVPVFGMLQGAVVTGIIDEISLVERPAESPKRRLSYSTPRKSAKRAKTVTTPPPDPRQQGIERFLTPSPKKVAGKGKQVAPATPTKARSPEPRQLDIEDFLVPSPKVPANGKNDIPTSSSKIPGTSKPTMQHAIHILDTKTRQTDSIPAEPDTYGSQLQLMLYHRLLTSLISSSTPFDFNALWSYLGLDNERRFGDGFLVQAGLWDGVEDDDISEDGSPRNLADVGRKWRKLVEGCTVVGVDDSMELVYRLQSKDHVGKWKGKGKASEFTDLANGLRNLLPAQNEEDTSGEARELAIAIRNSLIDISFPSYRPEYAAYAPCMDVDVDAGVDVELQNALYTSLSAISPTKDKEAVPLPPRRVKPHPMFEPGPPLPELPSTPPNQPVELEPQAPPPEVVEEPQAEYDNHGYKIVGRKQVQYDGPKLDAHLDSVFQFWRSERKPVGVPVELARRCNTCEYRNGCEWREEKALEAAASFQAGRTASSS